MNKDVMKLWTSALRSGDFKQNRGHLYTNGGYRCVMGVLTDIAMTMGICDYTQVKNHGAYDNELGRVPVSVQQWAELKGQNGEIEGEFCNLTFLNDKCDYEFDQLADIIEESYERM